MVTMSEKFRKIMKRVAQDEFKRRAENLVLDRQGGKFSGREDVILTEQLRNSFAHRNGEVDWELTYQLRLLIQEEHYKSEQLKRDRR